MKPRGHLHLYRWGALTLLIFLLGLYIQAHIFLSWDVSWHLEITQRFLRGENYLSGFMDINPPILMYTLIPPTLFAKYFAVNPVFALRGYVFLLSIVSLITCYPLCKKIFIPEEYFMFGGFFAAIATIFFLLPGHEFGQREHLVLIFLLPYFLLVIALMRNSAANIFLRIWVGLLAGIGFCINIEFVIIFIVLEIILACYKKTLSSCLRIECGIIVLLIALYLLSIFYFAPNYIHNILPLIKLLYLPTFNYTWRALFANVAFLSWLAVTILLFFHCNKPRYLCVNGILYCINTLFMVQFLLTRKLWYYHMLPTLAISVLLLTLFLCQNIVAIIAMSREQRKVPALLFIKAIIIYSVLVLLPLSAAYSVTHYSLQIYRNPESDINLLIQALKKIKPNSPIYVFSTTVTPGSTLIDYADVKLGSRFAGLWMLPGIVKGNELAAKQLQINLVVQDFENYKPNVVIQQLNPPYFPTNSFDFIAYFSQDQRFKQLWSHYHFLQEIEGYKVFVKK